MTKKPLLVLALCAGLTVAAYAVAGTSATTGKATVGEFAVKVAIALGYSTPDSKAAVEVLKARGVKLVADTSATLTEGEAARIMSDLGMKVKAPTNPGATVSPSKAVFLAGMIESLTIDPLADEVDLPEECLTSVDRGTCVNCCIVAIGPLPNPSGQGTRDAGKECGRYCEANVRPGPSPEEPTP